MSRLDASDRWRLPEPPLFAASAPAPGIPTVPRTAAIGLAAASRDDPDTSDIAARKAEASGSARDQRAQCLAQVMRHPGSTAAEIARLAGLERHAPSRRLPELVGRGLVRHGSKRKCAVMGSLQITWWPVTGITA